MYKLVFKDNRENTFSVCFTKESELIDYLERNSERELVKLCKHYTTQTTNKPKRTFKQVGVSFGEAFDLLEQNGFKFKKKLVIK